GSISRTADAVYPGPDLGRPGPRSRNREQTRADNPPGRCPVAHQSADRLPFSHPLSVRHRSVPLDRPQACRDQTPAFLRLHPHSSPRANASTIAPKLALVYTRATDKITYYKQGKSTPYESNYETPSDPVCVRDEKDVTRKVLKYTFKECSYETNRTFRHRRS